jgi:hypothetical protein
MKKKIFKLKIIKKNNNHRCSFVQHKFIKPKKIEKNHSLNRYACIQYIKEKKNTSSQVNTTRSLNITLKKNIYIIISLLLLNN